jgi:hypothetical protein
MTSIRMEPVWMILAESAGVAASMAVQTAGQVQSVDSQSLWRRLIEHGQKLDRPA